MASKPGTLKRSKATRRRGERASSDPLRDSTSPSPTRERQGSVTFDNQASTIYLTEDDILTQDDSSQLDTDGNQTDNYSAEKSGRNWCFLCRIQVELTCSRLFFRIFAVINFLSLIFSGPLVECDRQIDTTNGTQSAGCNAVFIQFVTITAVDFVLAIVYTLHTIARIEYAIHLLFKKSKSSPTYEPEVKFSSDIAPMKDLSPYVSWSRLTINIIITVSLWYSVAIGIYRSYMVRVHPNDPVFFWLYFPVFIRMLSIFTAIKLLKYLARLPRTSGFGQLFDNFKNVLGNLWKNTKRLKQLLYVTLFYLFFIYVYALVGVQWIGGLDKQCVHSETGLPSIPITHCAGSGSPLRMCHSDSNFVCSSPNDTAISLRIDERDTVYLGQFRTILDAMFAVYEASTWELWIFMEYNAVAGAPRHAFFIVGFYLALFTFLVIFVQQSIFLVVIIELFADFRVESSSEAAKPIADKPAIVLYEQQGQSNEHLQLKLIKQESSTAFQRKLDKYYFTGWHGISGDFGFIILVIIDAIIYSSKYTGMPEALGVALYGWQIAVSIIFLLEIIGLFFVHASAGQWLLFIKKNYFWYLIIIAVGGLASAIVYNPNNTYLPRNALVVFQAARLLRILRLPYIKTFFLRVIGNGSRLIIVIITVLVFLGCLSVVTVQLFGYLQEENECKRTGADQFRNFFKAYQSIFQLVMQEGWTEIMGEVMCYRDIAWIFINFGFIILHLVGSLILLNFFVAVILDNLEYDEETKKKKLEQDLKKQKVEKVPPHLRIFQYFGQKKIAGPKISSVEVPNLTEADVRNFYNVGEATEFPVNNESEQPSFVPEGSIVNRHSSELSNIELLTEDKAELCVSGVSTMQARYYGVQGILNYVKAFRQHSRAVEGNRPGQDLARGRAGYSGGVGSQLDSTPLTQSEYDEYREKYRLFDSALFCMPPEHPFRRCCKTLLNFRVSPSKSHPAKDLTSVQTASQLHRKLWNYNSYFFRKMWNYISYYFRSVVSSATLFAWVIILITVACLSVQLYELWFPQPTYVWVSDLVFILATLTELLLRIFANGLFFNPNAAIRSVWDFLDWLILLATLAVMIVYLHTCGSSPSIIITFNPVLVPIWMQILLLFRALRPLRIISLIPSMRRVIWDIAEGWKKMILGVVLFCLFLFLFASLGIHLFAGNGNPQEFCNDPRTPMRNTCVGEFEISVDISPHELIPNDNTSVPIFVPRVWYRHRRDFNFENFGVALLTLFQVLTTEGWLQVRDLFGSDSISRRKSESWIMTFYLHTFVFVGVNIVLQLFVGIMVNNYNEHKPNHSALLTVSQKRWSDLVQRISLTRPIKIPPEPRNRFRRYLYTVFVGHYKYYRFVPTIFVLLNSALLYVPWTEGQEYTKALLYLSIIFSVFFIIELMLKLVAFGLSAYFHSWRNSYDFVVALYNVTYVIVALIYLMNTTSELVNVNRVADMALFLAIFRLFTIHMKYGVFQNLMTTVYKAIYKSRALLGVLLMIALMYAFVGSLFFSGLRSGEAVNYDQVNFDGIFVSMNLVIRVVTGEDWHQILWDSMVVEPYCSSVFGNCGNVFVALVWFISFYIFVSFFLINVVIAVLLESFSIFYEDDDSELNRSVVKDFKNNWYYFDKGASGTIPSSRIKLFLRTLKIRQLHTYQIYENGVKERQKCDILSDPLLLREMAEELRRDHKQHVTKPDETTAVAGGNTQQQQELENSRENHSFQNVLKTLAYRAEDISKRLVPHELYVREELEQSVQFDVAEDCIYKWMQRFVKPVIKQERHRRLTVVQTPRPRREDSVMWDAPSLTVPEEDYSDVQLSAADTEDENDHLTSSLGLASLASGSYNHLRSHAYQQNKSDDETDVPSESHVSEKDRTLARSYAKLAKLGPPVDTGAKDKWHDWFRMQSEWMDKVETDPDNYFDDGL